MDFQICSILWVVFSDNALEAQKFLILMNLIYFSLFLVLLFLRTYCCIIQVHDLIQHFLVRDFLVLLLPLGLCYIFLS